MIREKVFRFKCRMRKVSASEESEKSESEIWLKYGSITPRDDSNGDEVDIGVAKEVADGDNVDDAIAVATGYVFDDEEQVNEDTDDDLDDT